MLPKSERSLCYQSIRLLTTTVAVACALAGATCAAAAQTTVVPAKARVMTAVEIHKLYRDKNWRWESGAGQMKDEGRQFRAWAEDASGKTWAEGRWVITNTGRMCFDATWHSQAGAFPAKTCFSHRIHDGTIYQKRDPGGEWYVFRHAKPQAGDEASKLLAADLVSPRLKDMKAAVSSTQLPN